MKLRTKFMTYIGLILVVLMFVDVKLGMDREKKIMLKDIEKWSFTFAENVRVTLNTLMREGRMDIRFNIFEAMTKEISGLKEVRVIRGEKVNEILKKVREQEEIPAEQAAIKRFEDKITGMKEDLKKAKDKDEQNDIKEEIASVENNISRSMEKIKKLSDISAVVDEREKPKDELDKEVLKTGQPLYRFEGDNARVLIPYIVKKQGCREASGCHKLAKEGDVLGAISMEFSIEDINREIRKDNTESAGLGIFRLGIILAVIAFLLSSVVISGIGRINSALKDIAEGKGDLTRRLEVKTQDEIGMLGTWFNKFVDGMQETVKGVNVASREVVDIAGKLSVSSQKVRHSADLQLRATEETSSSITEMEASISSVAEASEQILHSTDTVASSVLEMSASVDEIADSMTKLSDSVDTSTSSITEMGASIKQVAIHVNDVSGFADEIISSVEEISATISEIARYAGEQTLLSQKVKTDAASIGMESVRKTMNGMDRIKEEVSSTSVIINRLGERSEAVGQVLKVINNVTEATSLLSLNAAILAAQAGEHGRGFAVVADEIKELAEQTAASTKEISGLVKAFKDDVTAAIVSIERSSKGVDEGVELSWEAHSALDKIAGSTDQSLEMARRIETATREQSKGVNLVAESIQKMSGMVGEIKKATDEQKKGAEGIVRAAEQMGDIARMVKVSTFQQAKESKYTSEAVSDVAQKIKSVVRAIEEQKLAAARIVNAMEMVKKTGEDSVVLSADLDINVEKLNRQASSLKDEMGKFKV